MADLAAVTTGQLLGQVLNAVPVQTFSLPPLPYANDALEPYISAEIMTLHHDKHHAAYVAHLNKAVADYAAAAAAGRLTDQLALQAAVRFHGGGHVNHALFWPSLAPGGSADAAEPTTKAPALTAALMTTFGGLDAFQTAFSQALLGIQGSGWGWLVKTPTDALQIVTTKDQDLVVGAVPVLGIDMWEHAYYLQYQNSKQAYVDSVWHVLNWTTAEQRFTTGHVYDGIEVVLSV